MNAITPTRRKSSDEARTSLPALFNDFFSDPFFGGSLSTFPTSFFSGSATRLPSANIEETNTEFLVELCVPGLKRDDIKIDLEEGVMTIKSEKEEEKKENQNHMKRREFSYSSFSRSFSLPENVDEDKINAKYEDGILKVSIPKKEISTRKPKKEIKIS
jgi:HSP20 family protein